MSERRTTRRPRGPLGTTSGGPNLEKPSLTHDVSKIFVWVEVEPLVTKRSDGPRRILIGLGERTEGHNHRVTPWVTDVRVVTFDGPRQCVCPVSAGGGTTTLTPSRVEKTP